ncbi:hypothetical protein QTP88_026498 [Uroleucon formosanum]
MENIAGDEDLIRFALEIPIGSDDESGESDDEIMRTAPTSNITSKGNRPLRRELGVVWSSRTRRRLKSFGRP